MALLLSVPVLIGQPFSVMTYNIKYDNQQGGQDSWESRRDKMVLQLQHYQPAIFGIQEGLVHQLAFLDSALYRYAYTGVGRDDGRDGGEFSAIFYDSTSFELLESNTFWLSETPDTISVGWDAALERICTYGLFQHPQEQVFAAQEQVLDLHLADSLEEYIVQLVLATRNPGRWDESLAELVSFGASPRATIGLDRTARAHAWLDGRDYVSPDDIQAVIHDVLRHRVLLSYEAEADGVIVDELTSRLLDLVPVP